MLGALIAAALSYLAYAHHRAAQPISERVFDQVVSTVSLRYFDASYHGVAWPALVEHYRPQVIGAPNVAARYRALRRMLAQLRDSHTAVYSPDELKPMGQLKLARDARAEARVLQSAGSRARAVDEGPGPDVDWRTIAPDVGYLRIASFPDSINGVLAWAMTDIGRDRALVLDLRGNPGGLVDSVDAVAGVFLPEGTLISSGTRRYHLFGSERFTAHDPVSFTYGGRVVVLVDGGSQSGAESLARALQFYHRATLVGTHTAGKVLGVDAEIQLDDGGLLRVATLDMRAPDGQRLEGRGVMPDIVVAGAGAQLNTALRLIADQSVSAAPPPQAGEKSLGTVAACPVSIRDFSISGIGSTHRFLEYRIGIRASGRSPMSANFVASGDADGAPQTITATGLDEGSDAILFYWPGWTLKRVGIASVERGGVTSSCDPSESVALSDRAPMISDKGAPLEPGEEEMSASMVAELAPMDAAARAYVPAFDDSALPGTNGGVGRALSEARVLRHVMPYYPDIARETGAEGDALVAVVIGPGGSVLHADVVRSDAGPMLNGEALAAARRMSYSQPQVDGKPAMRTYLMVISFRLGGLTGLQFAELYSLPARFSISFL